MSFTRDSNKIKTHNLLFHKRTLNHLLRARSSLTFGWTIECGFTLKPVRDMVITYSLLLQMLMNMNKDVSAGMVLD